MLLTIFVCLFVCFVLNTFTPSQCLRFNRLRLCCYRWIWHFVRTELKTIYIWVCLCILAIWHFVLHQQLFGNWRGYFIHSLILPLSLSLSLSFSPICARDTKTWSESKSDQWSLVTDHRSDELYEIGSDGKNHFVSKLSFDDLTARWCMGKQFLFGYFIVLFSAVCDFK